MELRMSEKLGRLTAALLLLILPALILLASAMYGALNNTYLNAWFYILDVTWFGTGLVLYYTMYY